MFIQVKENNEQQHMLINCAHIESIYKHPNEPELTVLEMISGNKENGPRAVNWVVVDETIASLTHRLTMQRTVII